MTTTNELLEKYKQLTPENKELFQKRLTELLKEQEENKNDERN